MKELLINFIEPIFPLLLVAISIVLCNTILNLFKILVRLVVAFYGLVRGKKYRWYKLDWLLQSIR